MQPFISICIPAYNRTDFLKRLLDSIIIQEYKDYEVIITDDSTTSEVRVLCESYQGKLAIAYYKNETSLGTPENWNEAIRKASGEWIKLMHDDDWFSSRESLWKFAEAAKSGQGKFIFSSYTNVYFPGEKKQQITPGSFRLSQLKKDPASLLSRNIIGHPSTVMYKNTKEIGYDRNMKWLVDIDFYIRFLSGTETHHIKEPLVNIGMSEGQVTHTFFRNAALEIPEFYYMLEKMGAGSLKNILVYDTWWRLFRNLGIRNEADLGKYMDKKWPDIILRLLKDLNRYPTWLVKFGPASKLLMTMSYRKNRSRIPE